MGKKGKKAQAGKPKKLTPKDIGKRLDALVKKLEEELKGADLFAPMPPTEDCPICLVPLSRREDKSFYQACCGKVICSACADENKAAVKVINEKNAAKSKPLVSNVCPFCRTPNPSSHQEVMLRFEARKSLNDYDAVGCLGHTFYHGRNGQTRDDLKALDYYIQATELGSPNTPMDISRYYWDGTSITGNADRTALFLKVAALRGDIQARHNIGFLECRSGKHELGIRHWKIAAEGGSQVSLNQLRDIYNADGNHPGKKFISKDDLDILYRSCHVFKRKSIARRGRSTGTRRRTNTNAD